MNEFLIFALAALATYRLGWMLSQEEGPFHLFEFWRGLFVGDNWMGRGVRCYACVSFWAAWGTALFLAPKTWSAYVLAALGVAGAALLLERYWKR